MWNLIGAGTKGLNIFGQGNGGGSSSSNRGNNGKLDNKLITDKTNKTKTMVYKYQYSQPKDYEIDAWKF
jgi:hypothetical protein